MSVALSGSLFANSEFTFAIWFILLMAAFVFGWLIHKGFQYNDGIKVIMVTTIISIVLSLSVVVIFRDNFDFNNSLVVNIVLYSLRVLVLGLSGIFGLTVVENMKNQKSIVKSNIEQELPEFDPSQKAEYYIKEAKLKAEKIIFSAEKNVQQIEDRKKQIEIQLRELIHTEREVIRSYESEDSSNSISDETPKD
jgi:hypothetical protein